MRDIHEAPPWARAEQAGPALAVREGATFEHLCDPDLLLQAWRRVRANKGMAGGDAETIAAFEARLDARLAELRQSLLSTRYRPSRMRRASIPKPDGSKRWLMIPSVVDRVAQSAALLILQDDIDHRMSEGSWAYRSGRGVPQALAAVRKGFDNGLVWVVDADIEKYFDRVPHDRLMGELAIWIDDERLLRLFRRWLHSFGRWGVGIAQGSPISPLLANAYLHPVDRLMAAEEFRMIRYADDFVVLARTKRRAEQGLRLVERLLRIRRLRLNLGKTRIAGPGETLSFLGAEMAIPTGSQSDLLHA